MTRHLDATATTGGKLTIETMHDEPAIAEHEHDWWIDYSVPVVDGLWIYRCRLCDVTKRSGPELPQPLSSLVSSLPVASDAQSIADAFAHLPRPPRVRKKRGYSTDYRPRGKGQRYLLDKIPSTLWHAVRKKAQREGISVRALLLSLLDDWRRNEIVLVSTEVPNE